MYREVAENLLDQLVEKGTDIDLIWDFAAPFAAETLRRMLGLYNADQLDLQRWSQTMIDATGNYADDPEVWAKGERSFNEVDAALDEMLDYHLTHRDDSLISGLLSMPGETMPIEQIRANIKMTIGGGLDEPRDALGVAAFALLNHPDQREAVMANPQLWPTVFEETIRWIAPIGMYSRQTTQDTVLAGTHLPAGAKLGICRALGQSRRNRMGTRRSVRHPSGSETASGLQQRSARVPGQLGRKSRDRRSGSSAPLQQS